MSTLTAWARVYGQDLVASVSLALFLWSAFFWLSVLSPVGLG